jgi:hypothetical protein
VRFNLAPCTRWRLVSQRLMRFCSGNFAAILIIAALALICSCEKHHVGEMPEVQKEHVEGATGHEEAASEKSIPEAPISKSTPTPAEFFPAKP